MNSSPIYVGKYDYSNLRRMLAIGLHSNDSDALSTLSRKLERAVVVDADAIQSDTVAMDSCVEFEDLATGEVEECVLVFPEREDSLLKRISVLSPIGTALIGRRLGDVVCWRTPAGIRQLRVQRVTHARRSSLPEPSLWAPLTPTACG